MLTESVLGLNRPGHEPVLLAVREAELPTWHSHDAALYRANEGTSGLKNHSAMGRPDDKGDDIALGGDINGEQAAKL